MAFERRERSQSIPENPLDSNANNRMSLQLTSDQSTGKTWKKLFGSHNNKQFDRSISLRKNFIRVLFRISSSTLSPCLEPDLTYITPRLIGKSISNFRDFR